MAQGKLAVAVGTGNRAGVAVDAQDGGRYFGSGLAHNQVPRTHSLMFGNRHLPNPADRRGVGFFRPLHWRSYGVEIQRTAQIWRCRIDAVQMSAFQRDIEFCIDLIKA